MILIICSADPLSSGIYFLEEILHINIIRIETIEICTEKLTGKIRAWRDWEVLDEGVGSSLKTHLQEVLPICKGEQSLTFKRHQGSTADVQTLKIVLSHRRWEGDRQLIYYHRCLKITKRFELEHQRLTSFAWLCHFEGTLKLDYRKPWAIAILCQKL